jgi:TatD DNase family protein
MKIIDTHFHPDSLIEFQNSKNNVLLSQENIIENSKKNSVEKMFCISTEEKNFIEYLNLSKTHKEYYFSIGIHPCETKTINMEDTLIKLNSTIAEYKSKNYKIIGIGETGIDLYREADQKEIKHQAILFCQHIEYAIKYKLPLIIHTRNATEETFNILSNYKGKISGTIHAFCDNTLWAKKFIDLGFKLGIGGVISYPKNQHIREAIKDIGIEHLLLETDAPFLPLKSMRGKINHPQYCYDIGLLIAETLEIDHDYCFDKIYENTINTFSIS